jgi:hypothetical protein
VALRFYVLNKEKRKIQINLELSERLCKFAHKKYLMIMTAIKYNTREEAIAAVKLAIAKKREWMARVEREWAEEEVAKLSAR